MGKDIEPFAQMMQCMIDDVELSDSAYRLYSKLLLYRRTGTTKCWPKNETLAKAMGKDESSIRRSKRELVKRGLISVRKLAYSSEVTFLDFDGVYAKRVCKNNQSLDNPSKRVLKNAQSGVVKNEHSNKVDQNKVDLNKVDQDTTCLCGAIAPQDFPPEIGGGLTAPKESEEMKPRGSTPEIAKKVLAGKKVQPAKDAKIVSESPYEDPAKQASRATNKGKHGKKRPEQQTVFSLWYGWKRLFESAFKVKIDAERPMGRDYASLKHVLAHAGGDADLAGKIVSKFIAEWDILKNNHWAASKEPFPTLGLLDLLKDQLSACVKTGKSFKDVGKKEVIGGRNRLSDDYSGWTKDEEDKKK